MMRDLYQVIRAWNKDLHDIKKQGVVINSLLFYVSIYQLSKSGE